MRFLSGLIIAFANVAMAGPQTFDTTFQCPKDGSYPSNVYYCTPDTIDGFQALRDGAILSATKTSGIRLEEVAELYRVWPEELRNEAAGKSSDERIAMAWKRYGAVEDPFGDNPNVPLGFIEEVERPGFYNSNCLACHAGHVPGYGITVGAPNKISNLKDFLIDRMSFHTQVYPQLEEPLKSQVSRPEENAAFLQELMGTPEFLQNRAYNLTSGTSDVWLAGEIWMAVRDKDLNHILDPEQVVARMLQRLHGTEEMPAANQANFMDIKQWFDMSIEQKTHIFWDGFAPRSHKSLYLPGMPPDGPGANLIAAEPAFKKAFAFIASLKPVKYQGNVSQTLAQRGYELYHSDAGRCFKCHGTYDGNGHLLSYPNKTVNNGSDSTRRQFSPSTFYKQDIKDSWIGDYGAMNFKTEVASGYLAPSHKGIWSTYPYFHNGSIPSLRDVLFPEERPLAWYVEDKRDFDKEKMGYKYVGFSAMEEIPAELVNHPNLFVAQPYGGSSNVGHESAFENISPEDREAILEYLKTL